MLRVFVNCGYDLTERQLRQHFITFGVLSDLYLPKHPNGRNKGYAFVTFASEEALLRALVQGKHMVDRITVQVCGVSSDPTAARILRATTCLPRQAVLGQRVDLDRLLQSPVLTKYSPKPSLLAGQTCWPTSPGSLFCHTALYTRCARTLPRHRGQSARQTCKVTPHDVVAQLPAFASRFAAWYCRFCDCV